MRTTVFAILGTFVLIVALGMFAAGMFSTQAAQAAPCAQSFSTSITCGR